MALSGKLEDYKRAVAVADTLAIRQATNRLKTGGRRQVVSSGLGKRLANALRSTVTGSNGADITKRGLDPDPVGRVFSNAIVKRQGGTVDLLNVFETGTVVVPHRGQFLAMPTKAAGGRRARPMSSYPPNTFRLAVPRRGAGGTGANKPAFVAIHRERREVWYLLFRSVQLKARLKLAPLYVKVGQQIPALQARAWDRQVARIERRL